MQYEYFKQNISKIKKSLISRKFYISKNNNKVDYIETRHVVIANLFP